MHGRGRTIRGLVLFSQKACTNLIVMGQEGATNRARFVSTYSYIDPISSFGSIK